MDRSGNNITLTSNDKYTFNRVFTQYEINTLDEEFKTMFQTSTKHYIMLYGSPLNIKLFIYHKAVSSFIDNSFIDTTFTNKEIQFILLDEMAEVLMDAISSETSSVNIKDQCSVQDYDLYCM